MTQYTFSMAIRPDGKIGYFSKEARQAIILDRGQEKWVFVEMCKNHPEIMPNEILEGLGLAFGAMSKTAWEKLISLSRKAGGEIIT